MIRGCAVSTTLVAAYAKIAEGGDACSHVFPFQTGTPYIALAREHVDFAIAQLMPEEQRSAPSRVQTVGAHMHPLLPTHSLDASGSSFVESRPSSRRFLQRIRLVSDSDPPETLIFFFCGLDRKGKGRVHSWWPDRTSAFWGLRPAQAIAVADACQPIGVPKRSRCMVRCTGPIHDVSKPARASALPPMSPAPPWCRRILNPSSPGVARVCFPTFTWMPNLGPQPGDRRVCQRLLVP